MTPELAEALSEARADERKRCADKLREWAKNTESAAKHCIGSAQIHMEGAARALCDAAAALERL